MDLQKDEWDQLMQDAIEKAAKSATCSLMLWACVMVSCHDMAVRGCRLVSVLQNGLKLPCREAATMHKKAVGSLGEPDYRCTTLLAS